jgi:hypothetical protein
MQQLATPDLRILLTAIMAALLSAGCQATHQLTAQAKTQFFKVAEISPKMPPDRVNPVPIETDDAMTARNWPVTAAVYPNFSVTAGSTQTLFIAKPQKNSYFAGAMESPIFVLDVLLIPVAMFQAAPTAQVEDTSLYLPPTYTANPPADPTGRENLSGGPGIGWTPAFGRAAPFPKTDPTK